MKDFAKYFWHARNARGDSQTKAAKAIGVSRMTIAFWEEGRHLPGVLMLRKIARWAGDGMEEVIRACERSK